MTLERMTSVMKNKSVFFCYLKDNKKTFLCLIIIFFIGIILGITFINNVNSVQSEQIYSYVNSLKDNIKKAENINRTLLLKQSIKQNSLFVIFIWFLGCTILGSFLIYAVVLYKGFSIGYTVSAIIATLGAKTGATFAILSLLLQNIIFLPMIFILSESGIRLYKNLKQDVYVNMKKEFLRHTVIALITLVVSIISSFIEIYISTNFLIFFKEIY